MGAGKQKACFFEFCAQNILFRRYAEILLEDIQKLVFAKAAQSRQLRNRQIAAEIFVDMGGDLSHIEGVGAHKSAFSDLFDKLIDKQHTRRIGDAGVDICFILEQRNHVDDVVVFVFGYRKIVNRIEVQFDGRRKKPYAEISPLFLSAMHFFNIVVTKKYEVVFTDMQCAVHRIDTSVSVDTM